MTCLSSSSSSLWLSHPPLRRLRPTPTGRASLEDMHQLRDRHKGYTALQADKTGWKLLK